MVGPHGFSAEALAGSMVSRQVCCVAPGGIGSLGKPRRAPGWPLEVRRTDTPPRAWEEELKRKENAGG